jgi:Transporter associated domain
MMSSLGRIPTAGDQFEWQGRRFEVVDMDGNRVDKGVHRVGIARSRELRAAPPAAPSAQGRAELTVVYRSRTTGRDDERRSGVASPQGLLRAVRAPRVARRSPVFEIDQVRPAPCGCSRWIWRHLAGCVEPCWTASAATLGGGSTGQPVSSKIAGSAWSGAVGVGVAQATQACSACSQMRARKELFGFPEFDPGRIPFKPRGLLHWCKLPSVSPNVRPPEMSASILAGRQQLVVEGEQQADWPSA